MHTPKQHDFRIRKPKVLLIRTYALPERFAFSRDCSSANCTPPSSHQVKTPFETRGLNHWDIAATDTPVLSDKRFADILPSFEMISRGEGTIFINYFIKKYFRTGKTTGFYG
jgi:hypothetical protein